jgi:hypothetical protein
MGEYKKPNVCGKTSRRLRTERVEEPFLSRNVARSAAFSGIMGVPRMVA